MMTTVWKWRGKLASIKYIRSENYGEKKKIIHTYIHTYTQKNKKTNKQRQP